MGVNKSVMMLCISYSILSCVLDTHRYQILHYGMSLISFFVWSCRDTFQPESSRAELLLLTTGMHHFCRFLLFLTPGTVWCSKAPQYPWPCPIQDVLAACTRLAKQHLCPSSDPFFTDLYLIRPPPEALHKPIPSSKIVFAGDSAGAGLSVSVLTVLRDLGLPMPAGAVLISPWVDLTHSFPSIMENYESVSREIYCHLYAGNITNLEPGHHTTIWVHGKALRDLANPYSPGRRRPHGGIR